MTVNKESDFGCLLNGRMPCYHLGLNEIPLWTLDDCITSSSVVLIFAT